MKKVFFLLVSCLMLSSVTSTSPVDDVGNDSIVTVDDSNFDYSYDVTVPETGEYTTLISGSTHNFTSCDVDYSMNVFINPGNLYYKGPELNVDRAGKNSNLRSNYAITPTLYTELGGLLKVFSC